MSDETPGDYEFLPLTPERWSDFEKLFGSRGACGGCWCMFWRVPNARFQREKGEGNRGAMRELVQAGAQPGILAFTGGRPVGWCSVGPRPEFCRFETSRLLKPLDDQPVWSVVCFFIDREFRGQGLSVALLQAAVRFAAERGARIVEGYPNLPGAGRGVDAFIYMGLPSIFERAGFREAARPSPKRAIMRCYLEG